MNTLRQILAEIIRPTREEFRALRNINDYTSISPYNEGAIVPLSYAKSEPKVEQKQPTHTNKKEDKIATLLVEIAKLEEKYTNFSRGEKGYITKQIKAIKMNIDRLKNK